MVLGLIALKPMLYPLDWVPRHGADLACLGSTFTSRQPKGSDLPWPDPAPVSRMGERSRAAATHSSSQVRQFTQLPPLQLSHPHYEDRIPAEPVSTEHARGVAYLEQHVAVPHAAALVSLDQCWLSLGGCAPWLHLTS
jgi:hypothetical protein